MLNQRAGLNTDEYVSYSEFRTLLHYFRQYMELWLMFEAVDNSGNSYGGAAGDRKITFDEFKTAVPMIERWGSTDGRPAFTLEDPRAEGAERSGRGETVKWKPSMR